MSTPIRWITVDDTSTDIKYTGDSWFADKGSLDAIGSNGPPTFSTLHGTNSSASFAFNFTGSGLRVMGTYTQNSGAIDWACLLDGVNIDKWTFSRHSENHVMFFERSPLWDGHHTVVVTAAVGGNQTFWFDKIQYLPSASVSLENKSIMFQSSDPTILYGSGWSDHQTQRTGSVLVCHFYGISLSWYSTESGGNSTTGTWSIDDNPPNIFAVNGLGTNPTAINNQKYFETPQYSMGPHKLTVNYSGDSSKTPLNLAYLLVQNGTLPGSTGSSPRSENATSTNSNVGAIIGGAVGAACLLIVTLLFCFYRWRRDSAKDAPFIPFPALQSSFDAIASTSRPHETLVQAPVPFLSDSNVAHLGSPKFISSERKPGLTPRPQDGRMIGNIAQFVTIPRAPSRQEAHLPHQGPTKAQNTAGNVAVETFAPSDDDQQYSRNPSDPSNFGRPGPPGFVHQDSGVRITSQGLLQPLRDVPPAYTMD